jgi:hypothetical protein
LSIAIHSVVLRAAHILAAFTKKLIEAVALSHIIVAGASQQLGPSMALIKV